MSGENIVVDIIDHKNGTLEWNVSFENTDECKDFTITLICEGVKISSVLIASISLLAIKKLNQSPNKSESGYWRNWTAMALTSIVHTAFLAASITSFIQQSATGSGEDSISDLFNKIAASNMALHTIQVATNGFHFYTKHFSTPPKYQPVKQPEQEIKKPPVDNANVPNDLEAKWWLQSIRERMGGYAKCFGTGINRSVVVLQPILSSINVALSLNSCSQTTKSYSGFFNNK